jgi:hypothetical protein
MMVLDSLALCSAMLERFDEAERLLARADAIRDELIGKLWKVGRVEFSAWTYLLAGRPGDAERVLRPAYEAFDRIGEKGGTLAIHAALLAEAISTLGGRDQQAEQLSQIAEAAAADSEDVAAQGEWRMARATALARKGATADAERLASSRAAAREPVRRGSAGRPRRPRRGRAQGRPRVIVAGPRPARRAPRFCSSGQVAAVGRQHDAGQIGSVVACQEDGGGHLLGAGEPADPLARENAVEDFLGHAGRGRPERRGVDEARADRVHAHTALAVLQRCRLVSCSSPALAAA